jgi:alkanesulfonate monooxygenase SsuD/methylene tetrahydromethanopterin reductase-like flavin-dependent oxidoreductase (luciferase family)
VLAKMVATTDILSGGRVDLGIGAGWNQQESGAYGIDLGGLRQRFDRFDEACQVIISLLSQETTDFDGAYYHLTEARCEPKGPQRPHPPIVIGGGGEKRTLRAVARYAQGWDASLVASAEDMVRKFDILHAHCQEIGRDPGEIVTSSHLWFDPAETEVGKIADDVDRLTDRAIDVAIIYLAPPLDPAVLTPLAEALAPLNH